MCLGARQASLFHFERVCAVHVTWSGICLKQAPKAKGIWGNCCQSPCLFLTPFLPSAKQDPCAFVHRLGIHKVGGHECSARLQASHAGAALKLSSHAHSRFFVCHCVQMQLTTGVCSWTVHIPSTMAVRTGKGGLYLSHTASATMPHAAAAACLCVDPSGSLSPLFQGVGYSVDACSMIRNTQAEPSHFCQTQAEACSSFIHAFRCACSCRNNFPLGVVRGWTCEHSGGRQASVSKAKHIEVSLTGLCTTSSQALILNKLLCAGQPVPKGRAAVGWRIAVHWKEDAKFYAGEVTSFDTATGRHEVLYDDGEASF